jgi:hypothetical protein
MPLRKGSSAAIVKANFQEFGKGKTYARTKRKFGAARANKQRIAAVLSQKRDSQKKKR